MTGQENISGKVRQFRASDGTILHYRHFRTVETPRGFVVGCHGIQSHSGWYEWSSSQLAKAGFDVRFIDRRGAGLNDPPHGHADDATRLCKDVEEILSQVRLERDHNRQPVVLMGVSWAGKLLAGWQGPEDATRTECDGIALLYPAIFTHFDPGFLQRIAIRAASRVGLGRRTVPIPLNDPKLFTDDTASRRYIETDPLTLRRVSLSFLNATLDLTEQAKRLSDRDVLPMLIALAGRDEIVELPRTRAWAAGLPAGTTQIVEYPQARHTLEFDACRERFVADLINWLESVVLSHR